MQICVISDTHQFHEQITIPKCDVLIHAGDFSSYGHKKETIKFLDWFQSQPADHKIFICGNHELCWEQDRAWVQRTLADVRRMKNVHYLEDSGTEIKGIKFWGSPWSPEFCNWAFNLPRGGDELYRKWQQIPRDTDILITHSPLNKILDLAPMSRPPYPPEAGCELLRHRVEEIGTIKYCLFGHIHGGYSGSDILNPTYCINASICNEAYKPINKPVIIEI